MSDNSHLVDILLLSEGAGGLAGLLISDFFPVGGPPLTRVSVTSHATKTTPLPDQSPHLVIVDGIRNGVTGQDLVSRAKAVFPDTPIGYLCSNASLGEGSGATAYRALPSKADEKRYKDAVQGLVQDLYSPKQDSHP